MKPVQIRLRLEAQLLRDLEEAARVESLDRVEMLRKLLRQGLAEHKRETTLMRYQRGEVSIGRASEESGLSHWEIIDIGRDRGWTYPFDAGELEQELKASRR